MMTAPSRIDDPSGPRADVVRGPSITVGEEHARHPNYRSRSRRKSHWPRRRAAPGPGHSAADRSLSVKLDAAAPDGFIVTSFAGDDALACKDYVREKLGLSPFKPNGGNHRRPSDDVIEKAVMAAAAGQVRNNSLKGKIVVQRYDYTDADGVLLYQVLRYEPKDFRQRRPDGNGGWSWRLDERRVLYRWPELLKFPDATVFITEGEKDADRVATLGHCATTVTAGKWTDECVKALAGRDVIILEDNDDAGRKKALVAAQALYATAKTIRLIALPGLKDKGDVSDWLDADSHNTPRSWLMFVLTRHYGHRQV
jgi:hypothetical protein